MNLTIRGVILGTVGLALLVLAGCSDNEKAVSKDFKDTKTASPEVKPVSNEDMQKRYSGANYPGGRGNPGSAPTSSPPPKK